MMLANLGVGDDDWLDVVSSHHDDAVDKDELRLVPPAVRLARILKVVDRYAAMISPRKSRSGRSAIESARSVMTRAGGSADEIGPSLLQAWACARPAPMCGWTTTSWPWWCAAAPRATNRLWWWWASPMASWHLRRACTARPRPTRAYARPCPRTAVRAPLNHFYILQLGSQTMA